MKFKNIILKAQKAVSNKNNNFHLRILLLVSIGILVVLLISTLREPAHAAFIGTTESFSNSNNLKVLIDYVFILLRGIYLIYLSVSLLEMFNLRLWKR